MIRTTTITIGKAREEGRQSSHDGECMTLYWNQDTTEWLLTVQGMFVASHYMDYIEACDVDAELSSALSDDAYNAAYNKVYAGICEIQDEIDLCVNDDWQDRYEVANAINEGNQTIEIMQEWGWPVHEHDGSWFVDEI